MAPKFPWQVVKLIIESAMSVGLSFKDLPKNIQLFEQLVKKQGVTPDDIERLMEAMEKGTGRTDLAIIFARTFIPESIDDYLTLAYTAENLNNAVELLSINKWILHPSVDLAVSEQGDVAAIKYQSRDGFPIGDKYFYAEGLFSCILHRVRDVTGLEFTPIKIHFRHGITPHHDKYNEYFGCPVIHDCDTDAIFISTDVLYAPFKTHDREASLALQQKAAEKTKNSSNFVAEVSVQLSTQLDNEDFGIEDLASHMHMSPRSLQRKLKDFGLTFSLLKNSVRIQRAKEHFEQGYNNLEDISAELGFVNAHSFRQFFKKQTGMTVGEYRAAPLMQESLRLPT
ncbi:helix-turn-helix domain-containing protein [Alkalimarinus coralli]|uniref:helix-turn-helix domain-containing protein n=1 Tax=Alkalimarinus coralli TaxID=2935863 RepID=UPI00202B4E47|nr:AraC family transcriptional regulator [Alkalimarinus coralli]